MTVGLLDPPRGRHAAPPTADRPASEFVSYGLIFGERDTASSEALRFLQRAVDDPPSKFSYGEHFDWWDDPGRLTGQESYAYGTIGARRVSTFFAAANELATEQKNQVWNRRAVTAVEAILNVVDSPDDTEELALQIPFDEWRGDQDILPVFTGWLYQMVDAYDDPDGEQWHLLRDDSQDKNADQFGPLGTEIRLGTGRAPVFVITEPAIRDGKLVEEVWIAKRRKPEDALRLLNRHDLISRTRISRVLDEAGKPATPQEKEYILWYADRAAVQDDNDARAWLEWCRSPAPSRGQRIRQAAGAILGVMADSRFIRWIEQHT